MDVNISSTTAAQSMDSYRAIFEKYINTRADHLMEIVQQADFVNDSSAHKKLMHALSYAFQSTDSWISIQKLLLAAAPLMQRAGYRHEWIPYLQTSIEQSADHNDMSSCAQLNYELGFIYQTMGQLQDAQTHYKMGISRIERNKELLTYAKIVNKLAFVKRLQQNHQESEQLVLELLPQLDPTDPEYGKSHLVLGWIAYDQHDWKESEYHFRKALDVWEAMPNTKSYASGLRDLATVLQMQQKYEAAISYHQQSLQIFEEIGESHMGAVTIMNLGIVYLLTEKPQQALAHFQHTESEFRRVQDAHHLSLAYLNMGIAYRELAQPDKSIENLLSAIDIWIGIGSTDMLVNMLTELGVSYTKADQIELATSAFNEALGHLEKIYDTDVSAYHHREILIRQKEAGVPSGTPASR